LGKSLGCDIKLRVSIEFEISIRRSGASRRIDATDTAARPAARAALGMILFNMAANPLDGSYLISFIQLIKIVDKQHLAGPAIYSRHSAAIASETGIIV
jgi:hypothetical protein